MYRKEVEYIVLQTENTRTSSADTQSDSTKSKHVEEQQPNNAVISSTDSSPAHYTGLDPDKVLDAYGFGRYQFFGYFLSEGVNLFYSAAMYVMPYVTPNPILGCTYK
ncbi:hypothetical protein TELCIR_20774, partial [Teladorsagia circumcincta]